jgi:hypothetical protein
MHRAVPHGAALASTAITGAASARDGRLLLAGSFDDRLVCRDEELISAGVVDGFVAALPR